MKIITTNKLAQEEEEVWNILSTTPEEFYRQQQLRKLVNRIREQINKNDGLLSEE